CCALLLRPLDGALELLLVHARAAFDLQTLGLGVELLLRLRRAARGAPRPRPGARAAAPRLAAGARAAAPRLRAGTLGLRARSAAPRLRAGPRARARAAAPGARRRPRARRPDAPLWLLRAAGA